MKRVTILLAAATAFTLAAFDTMPIGRIFPKPQKVIGEYQIIPAPATVVLVNKGLPDDLVAFAAEIYNDGLASVKAHATAPGEGAELRIVAGLLSNPDIAKYWSSVPELSAQGYAIKILNIDGSAAEIVVGGSDNRGAFYGVVTVMQLLDIDEAGKAIQKLVGVEDFPVWTGRFVCDFQANASRDGFKVAAANKFSGSAALTDFNWRKPEWWEEVTPIFEAQKKLSDAGVMTFLTQLHLYHMPWASKEGRINLANEEEIDEFVSVCRRFAEYGTNIILIAADDTTKRGINGYEFYYPEENTKFKSVGEAHGYLVKRCYDALLPDFPNLRFFMVPAPYSLDHGIGLPEIDRYVLDWAATAPDDADWIWTGPGVFSPSITAENNMKMRKLLGNHKTHIWDNSNGIYGPMPRWNSRLYKGMEKDDDGIIFNLGLFYKTRPWERPYFFSVNEYLWNPEAYEQVEAYDAALALLHGKHAVAPINKVRDAFTAALTLITNNDREGFDAYFKAFEQAFLELEATPDRDGEKIDTTQIKQSLQYARHYNEYVLNSATVPQIDTPVIDGVLSPGEWDKATQLTLTNRGKKHDDPPATMDIGYKDGKEVYFAFDMPLHKPFGDTEVIDFDGPVFASPGAVELFLQMKETVPGRPISDYAGEYAHLAFDQNASRYDAHADRGHHSWHGDWIVEVKLYPERWTAELLFRPTPLRVDAMVMPAPGVKWRANFHRVDNRTALVQSWDTSGWSFHQSIYFGWLKFE